MSEAIAFIGGYVVACICYTLWLIHMSRQPVTTLFQLVDGDESPLPGIGVRHDLDGFTDDMVAVAKRRYPGARWRRLECFE